MNPEDSATKKDLEGLQGTWRLISAMEDGKSLAEDKVKQTTIVIKDDTFRFPHLAEDATSKAGPSSSTRRKSRSRWTQSRPRKRSCSASTSWKETVTGSASRRSARHVPANSLRSPEVATSSKSGSGRKSRSRSSEADHWLGSIIESAHSLR